MSAVKITTFLGILPKVSSELLPETAGQIARNTNLVSGDLVPFPAPVVAGNSGVTGTVKTLYAFKDDAGDNRWLAWNSEVDVAIVTASGITDRRFYYTGDGVPKVSNYSMAFSGPGPYPADYYDLGLPLPTTKPTVTVTPFTTAAISSFSRDTNNIVSIITSTPHTLRSGAIVTISGFSYKDGTYTNVGTAVTCTIIGHGLPFSSQVPLEFPTSDATPGVYTATKIDNDNFSITLPVAPTGSGGSVRISLLSFNATSVTATVTSSTALQYFSPGFAMSSSAVFGGSVDLGGAPTSRSYVYTWVTPWDEESIASEPTTEVFVREGTTVTISALPTAKPAGNNFVRGISLYRTVATATAGTEYFRLKTLWFPNSTIFVRRDANVATVQTEYPHELGIGDRFKISGCTDATFNVTGGIVIDIPDDSTFTYASVGSDTPVTAVASGTLFQDISENPPTTTARYWGDGGNYDFIDDFNVLNLSSTLGSDNYDPPPADLTGLTAVQNNILAGFVRNKLYLTPPNTPHAWPEEFSVTFEYDIVGLVPVNGAILVLTKGYPFAISGNDPTSALNIRRIDVLYPCLSKRGIVPMNYGVVYPTHDGLAVFSATSGPDLITRANFDNDAWDAKLDPTTIVADFFGDRYVASHSSGGFVFEPNREIGGQYVDTDLLFTATYYDPIDGKLYTATGALGDIVEWDPPNQPPLTLEWKSKTIKTPRMLNLGAARIIADYGPSSSVWGGVNTNWEATTIVWSALDNIIFNLWVNKELIFTDSISDANVFRLPTGYLSDTFEVGVESDVRVRAIHLGETPLSLKEV
jgi:hypothetical protein